MKRQAFLDAFEGLSARIRLFESLPIEPLARHVLNQRLVDIGKTQ